MKALNIPFEEVLHKFGEEDFKQFSPTGTVPCLYEEIKSKKESLILWDSLAIVDHLSETYKNIWPNDKAARAWSRSACAEMHSGFTGIRNACSMSCGVRVKLKEQTPALLKDIARLEELWEEGLNQFGGPFLAGKNFSAVDAMFAPVVFRIQTYGLTLSDTAQNYIETILSHSAVKEWYDAAISEDFQELAHEEWINNAGTIERDFRAARK